MKIIFGYLPYNYLQYIYRSLLILLSFFLVVLQAETFPCYKVFTQFVPSRCISTVCDVVPRKNSRRLYSSNDSSESHQDCAIPLSLKEYILSLILDIEDPLITPYQGQLHLRSEKSLLEEMDHTVSIVFYFDNTFPTKISERNEWENVVALDHRSIAIFLDSFKPDGKVGCRVYPDPF